MVVFLYVLFNLTLFIEELRSMRFLAKIMINLLDYSCKPKKLVLKSRYDCQNDKKKIIINGYHNITLAS